MQHERHEIIKKMLEIEGLVSAQDLANRFNVSTETIRRDLESMEAAGLVQRVHGGAVSTMKHLNESAYQTRVREHHEEKRAIGQKAAEFIEDGDTVLIAPGTTTFEAATSLKDKKNLTIVTNSLQIATALSGNPDITLCFLGGQVDAKYYSVTGFIAADNLRYFNYDKLIMGIECITVEQGITDSRLGNALIHQKFTEYSPVIIGVTDSSKFGNVAKFNICPVSKLDYLITDDGINPKQKKLFKEQDVKLITVKVQ